MTPVAGSKVLREWFVPHAARLRSFAKQQPGWDGYRAALSDAKPALEKADK